MMKTSRLRSLRACARVAPVMAGAMVVVAVWAAGIEPAPAEQPAPKVQIATYDLTESSRLSTPVLAAGTLYGPDGRPTGGRVVAFAWPNDDVLATLEEGEGVTRTPIAYAEIGKDGRYEMRADPRVDPRTYAQRTRQQVELGDPATTDIDITGYTTAGDPVGWSIPRASRSTAGRIVAWQEPGSTAEELAPVDLHAGEAPDLPDDAAHATAGPTEPGDKGVCDSAVLVDDLGSHWALVFEQGNQGPTTSRFTYTQGASSTLGIAVNSNPSASWGSAGWTRSGTNSKSSSATVGFPAAQAGKSYYLDTKFKYGQFLEQVWSTLYGCTFVRYSIRAYQWNGGSRVRPIPNFTFGYCEPYAKGTTFHREKNAATTWNDGAEISAMIGVSMSIQTGITSKTEVNVTFTNRGKMCGSNDQAVRAYRIASKK